jgi:hypothetical protein
VSLRPDGVMAMQELLRKELIEFQKAQSVLVRWKLVAIGAIFGLAFNGTVSFIVLIVVPLIAVYCDLLYRNYDIRIALISWHLAYIDNEWFKYQNSLKSFGHPWVLNSSATLLASLAACISVTIIDLSHMGPESSKMAPGILTWFGGGGGAMTVVLQIFYSNYQHRLTNHWEHKIRDHRASHQ